MKKSLVLAVILSVGMLALSLSAYADDISAQISALEQQAERIQSQINQTKQQCGGTAQRPTETTFGFDRESSQAKDTARSPDSANGSAGSRA